MPFPVNKIVYSSPNSTKPRNLNKPMLLFFKFSNKKSTRIFLTTFIYLDHVSYYALASPYMSRVFRTFPLSTITISSSYFPHISNCKYITPTILFTFSHIFLFSLFILIIIIFVFYQTHNSIDAPLHPNLTRWTFKFDNAIFFLLGIRYCYAEKKKSATKFIVRKFLTPT